MSEAECHSESSYCYSPLAEQSHLSFPKTTAYLVTGFTPHKQCQAWVSSYGVCFKSNQILVGFFQIFCTTIAPAHLVSRSPLHTEVFRAGSLCSTFQYHEYFMKDLVSHQISFSMFNELFRCCSNRVLPSAYDEKTTALAVWVAKGFQL